MNVDLARIFYDSNQRRAEELLTKGDYRGIVCNFAKRFPSEWSIPPNLDHGTCYIVRGDMLVPTGVRLGRGSQSEFVDELISLISKKRFAIKKILGDINRVFAAYQALKDKPGIVSIEYIFENKVVEPRYGYTLLDKLSAQDVVSCATRVSTLYQIALGLQSIHHTDWKIGGYSYKLYHGNIKPGNIFWDGTQYLIGDFGTTGDVRYYGCSPYMMAPEYAEEPKDIAEFNIEYGKLVDIWRLGFTFAAVLKNRVRLSKSGVRGIIPLKFIEEGSRLKTKLRAGFFASLSQDRIDHDTKYDGIDLALRRCWELVTKMLRLKPKERIGIDAVVDELAKIKSEYFT